MPTSSCARTILWLLLFALLSTTVESAVKHKCGTRDPKHDVLQSVQSTLAAQQSAQDAAASQDAAVAAAAAATPLIITIRVVWHIVYSRINSEAYKLAKQPNQRGVVSLNQALAQLNADFNAQSASVNVKYRFISAGAPLLHRVTANDIFKAFCGPNSDRFGNALKAAYRKGNACTLNLYVLDSCDDLDLGTITLGVASFPWELASVPAADGILLNALSFYRSITNTNTWTHEVGHWLGLLHTFMYDPYRSLSNDGCTDPYGDYVGDTPAEKEPHYGSTCRNLVNSCPRRNGFDPWWNHMSYFACAKKKFTKGQHVRMKSSWLRYRRPRCTAAG